jgi:hypothetical protein
MMRKRLNIKRKVIEKMERLKIAKRNIKNLNKEKSLRNSIINKECTLNNNNNL